ncbi:hypothetical protein NDU88_012172 [Pleurodeles waltl]|uniref:Uncharacterized protein n=1 Tax=Pleurodeles waltl TaxID=8319 RepID=A0AAV7QZE6_PLEWA|nr:hypothetical protein NDU88_012172 [Pleurodeles waltl]
MNQNGIRGWDCSSSLAQLYQECRREGPDVGDSPLVPGPHWIAAEESSGVRGQHGGAGAGRPAPGWARVDSKVSSLESNGSGGPAQWGGTQC